MKNQLKRLDIVAGLVLVITGLTIFIEYTRLNEPWPFFKILMLLCVMPLVIYLLPTLLCYAVRHMKPMPPKKAGTFTLVYAVFAYAAVSAMRCALGAGVAGIGVLVWSWVNYTELKKNFSEENDPSRRGRNQPGDTSTPQTICNHCGKPIAVCSCHGSGISYGENPKPTEVPSPAPATVAKFDLPPPVYTFSLTSFSQTPTPVRGLVWWAHIICNEDDITWDSDIFVYFLKRNAMRFNNGLWNGKISLDPPYPDGRYIIENDPYSFVYQYDTLFGLVMEIKCQDDLEEKDLCRILSDYDVDTQEYLQGL